MSTYRFFKYKNAWLVKVRPGFESAEPVTEKIIESVLGVTGSREVIVLLEAKTSDTQYRVHVNNGFITEAWLATKESNGSNLEEINEFFTREMI